LSNSPKITILELIARLNIGGPAVLVLDLAAGLPQQEFDIRVAAGKVGPGEATMDFWANARNISWTQVPGLSPELGDGNITALRALSSLLREIGPDVLHTHTAKAGSLGRAAGIKARWGARRSIPRLVHTFHGHVFKGYFSPLKTRLFLSVERFLARFTDRIIVLSEEQARDIGKVYRICPEEKIRIIPVGLEMAPFVESFGVEFRESLGISPYTFVIGSIGRLTAIKDHRTLLRGVALAARKVAPPLALVIVGQGELEEEIREEAVALGVDIHFAGWRQGTADLLPSFDLVALTSLNEGLPLVLLEALAAGRPVVSTPVGGVPSLFSMGDAPIANGFTATERGLLFPVGDSEGLAQAILWVTAHLNQSLEMARRGQHYVIHRHNQEKYLDAHAQLYRGLVSSINE
jgi:glycosyltransferase involved in cell wall biosynthesis